MDGPPYTMDDPYGDAMELDAQGLFELQMMAELGCSDDEMPDAPHSPEHPPDSLPQTADPLLPVAREPLPTPTTAPCELMPPPSTVPPSKRKSEVP
eukprot:15473478-Alexandrium_andersonii.AAC.1